jgi:hypothetical protein
MNRSEKIILRGPELTSRLAGISTPIGGISWKPPAVERDKARRLLADLAGERSLHYPYDREIKTFIAKSIRDIRERLANDIEDLPMDSILRQILRGMQAACRKFLDENQFPSAGYGWPYEAQLHCTLGELRALFGIHIGRIACEYDVEVDACLGDILPPEPDKSNNANSGDSGGS